MARMAPTVLRERRSAGLLVVLVVACGLPRPAGINAPEFMHRDYLTDAPQVATCVIDVGQASFSLAQAGLMVRRATKVCKPLLISEDQKAMCSVAISGVLSYLAYTASFISGAASNCGPTLNIQAYCGADVGNFVASLALLAGSASGMTQTCSSNFDFSKIFPGLRQWYGRRLAPITTTQSLEAKLNKAWLELQAAEAIKDDRSAEIADCVFNAGQALFWLTRAVLTLEGAARDCAPRSLHTDGTTGQMLCSVDITGLIGSLSWVARAISLTVSECPVVNNQKALCAADSSGVIAAAAGMAASGSSFMLTCCDQVGTTAPPQRLPAPRWAPAHRRLDANATLVAGFVLV